MGWAVFLAGKVDVIGRHHLCTCLFCKHEDTLVCNQLPLVHLLRLTRNLGLMFLHFQIEVFSEDSLMPHYSLFRSLHITCDDRSRDLTGYTCRAAHKPLGILFHNFM